MNDLVYNFLSDSNLTDKRTFIQSPDQLALSHITMSQEETLLTASDFKSLQQSAKFKIISPKNAINHLSNIVVMSSVMMTDIEEENDQSSDLIESCVSMRRSNIEYLHKSNSIVSTSPVYFLAEEIQSLQNRQAFFSYKSFISQASRQELTEWQTLSQNQMSCSASEVKCNTETMNNNIGSRTTQILSRQKQSKQNESKEFLLNEIQQNMRKSVQFHGEKIHKWIFDSIEANGCKDFIEKFIFHKKYKDFDSEELKYKGISKFHNLNRMFMHSIIKILSLENMKKCNVPTLIAVKIAAIIEGIKNHAFKKYNNGRSKTCFFNHYHYNLLFLRINSSTLKLFESNSKDLDLHTRIIGVALSKDDNSPLNSQDVTFCNLIKQYIYSVVRKTIIANLAVKNYNNCIRVQYVFRVIKGIDKLNEGCSIKRF